MKFAAAVLVLILLPEGPPQPPAGLIPPTPPPTLRGPSPALAPTQDWLGEPILPGFLAVASDHEGDEGELPERMPPLSTLPVLRQEPSPRKDPSPTPEPSFPRGVSGLDIQAWKEEDDLRQIREWAGDAIFGLPLLLPQLLLEGVVPRGLAVGPTTFLYRTDKTSSSFSLVVFDQMLFHEAQFAEQAQAYGADGAYQEEFQRGQRRVLRRSITSGFRASYALPRLSMEQILQIAGEQGTLGYVVAPPVLAALVYAKGLDQKIDLSPDVRCRFKLASGQRLARGMHSDEGNQAFCVELKFCQFPVGVVACVDIYEHGLRSSFIGLGTSLDTVEELLSREELARHPYETR